MRRPSTVTYLSIGRVLKCVSMTFLHVSLVAGSRGHVPTIDVRWQWVSRRPRRGRPTRTAAERSSAEGLDRPDLARDKIVKERAQIGRALGAESGFEMR